jgi:hypothetical protein
MRGAAHPRESGDLDDRHSDREWRPEESCRRHPLTVPVEKRRGLACRSRCSSSCDGSIFDGCRRSRSANCSPTAAPGRICGGARLVSHCNAVGARARLCARVARRSARSRRGFAQHAPMKLGITPPCRLGPERLRTLARSRRRSDRVRFVAGMRGSRGDRSERTAALRCSSGARDVFSGPSSSR